MIHAMLFLNTEIPGKNYLFSPMLACHGWYLIHAGVHAALIMKLFSIFTTR